MTEGYAQENDGHDNRDKLRMIDQISMLNRLASTELQKWISNESVALLDFPSHKNAGDSFIYLGQNAHFKQLGVTTAYVADSGRYRKQDLDRYHPQGAVLIQGGGNLGDRWEEMQQFRERVILENLDRRVIQLPQSLDFATRDGIARAAAAFSKHPKLTLLIREHKSLALAREYFPTTESEFCPDLALGMGPLAPLTAPRSDVVLLIRKDSESLHSGGLGFEQGIRTEQFDWHLDAGDRFKWAMNRLPGMLLRRLPALLPAGNKVLAQNYANMADINLSSANRLLSRGRVVVTDRLHATVLGALLGKEVIALDNSNGKVSAVHRDFLAPLGNIQLADDPADAVAKATALL